MTANELTGELAALIDATRNGSRLLINDCFGRSVSSLTWLLEGVAPKQGGR